MKRMVFAAMAVATLLPLKVYAGSLICGKDLNANGVIDEATEKVSCIAGGNGAAYCPLGAVACAKHTLALSGSAEASIPNGVANYIGFTRVDVVAGSPSLNIYKWPDTGGSQQYSCSADTTTKYATLADCTSACSGGYCAGVASGAVSAGKITFSSAPLASSSVNAARITKLIGNGSKLDVYGCSSATGISCSSSLLGSIDFAPFSVSGTASADTGLLSASASADHIDFDGYSCDESSNCQTVSAGSIHITWSDYSCPLGNHACVDGGAGMQCSATECIDSTLGGVISGAKQICGKDVSGDGLVGQNELRDCLATPQGNLCPVDAVDCNVHCDPGYVYNKAKDRCEAPPTCTSGTYVAARNRCESPAEWSCSDPSFTQHNEFCEKAATQCEPGYSFNSSAVQCEKNVVTTAAATPVTELSCKPMSQPCSQCGNTEIVCNADKTVSITLNDCCSSSSITLSNANDLLAPQTVGGGHFQCGANGQCSATASISEYCSIIPPSIQEDYYLQYQASDLNQSFVFPPVVTGYTCSTGTLNSATHLCETVTVASQQPACPSGSSLVDGTNICRMPAVHSCVAPAAYDTTLSYPGACYTSACGQSASGGTVSLDPAAGMCWSSRTLACPSGNYACMDADSLNHKWQCSPTSCASVSQDTGTSVNGDADTKSYQDDGAKDGNGVCLGQVLFFNGKGGTCRTGGLETHFMNCCFLSDSSSNSNTSAGQSLINGIINPSSLLEFEKSCSQDERLTVQKKNAGACHYVGKFCRTQWPLVGCVQEAQTYCCFNSKMGRIVQEYGRPQLKTFTPVACTATASDLSAAAKAANHDPRVGCYYGWNADASWGTPKAPKCDGISPEDFQMLDFDRIDFSEMYSEMGDKVKTTQENAKTQMEQKANDKVQQQTHQ